MVLTEVSNNISHDAFLLVTIDESVPSNAFDIEEDGWAKSSIIDIIEATDCTIDGQSIYEVFEEKEFFVE